MMSLYPTLNVCTVDALSAPAGDKILKALICFEDDLRSTQEIFSASSECAVQNPQA